LGFESSIFKQAIRSETTARILCHFSKTGHLREVTKGCLLDVQDLVKEQLRLYRL